MKVIYKIFDPFNVFILVKSEDGTEALLLRNGELIKRFGNFDPQAFAALLFIGEWSEMENREVPDKVKDYFKYTLPFEFKFDTALQFEQYIIKHLQ